MSCKQTLLLRCQQTPLLCMGGIHLKRLGGNSLTSLLPRSGSVGSAQHFRTNWALSLEPNTVQAHVASSECCKWNALGRKSAI